MEQGTHSTLKIPSHEPTAFNNVLNSLLTNTLALQAASRGSGGLELDGLRSLGVNPSHALQHPGFYYYMAARCTELRRERFLAILDEIEARNVISLSTVGF